MNDGRIHDLWKLGRSALEIARIMKTTRSTIAGRLYRMGLKDDARDIHRKIEPKMKPAPPPALEPPIEPLSTMLTVASGQCRFPMWDTETGEMPVCGRPVHGELTYCLYHARQCHQGKTE